MKACPKCNRTFLDDEAHCALDGAELAPDPEVAAPRDLGRVLGKYRLISQLGEGGMGRVFLGRHVQIKRLVAIKWLRKELQRRSEIGRFFEEAQAVNRVRHQNIVEVIDAVEDVMDGAYCVMEPLNGHDLRRELETGPLPLERAVAVAAQTADALAAVHGIGIVHRDLKPENLVLIERGGRNDFVKVLDFGVAQMSDAAAAGATAGTPAYMAPEQARGDRVDGRADIYSLGVILFEMVTGEHPFPSQSDGEYLLRHADEAPRRPRTPEGRALPRGLDEAILRCLAKRPEERFESAGALAAALRAVDVAGRAPRRSVGRVVLIAGGVLVAAALSVGWVARAQRRRVLPAPPPPAAAAPAVEASQPERVTLSFRSEPPGAEVRRAGETIALGLTPFEEKFAKGSNSLRLIFHLADHQDAELEVALDASREVAAKLPRLAPPPVAAAPPGRTTRPAKPSRPHGKPHKPGGKVSREGSLDPFAQ